MENPIETTPSTIPSVPVPGKVYFGFAIADGMFPGSVSLRRLVITADEAKSLIADGQIIPALNPTHKATIDAMQTRYGINVEIPSSAPKISLAVGDSFIVMSVRGLPRREGVAEYTAEEVAAATFEFSVWSVDANI